MQTIGKNWERVMQGFTLLAGATAAGESEEFEVNTDRISFQPSLYGTSGDLTATVKLYGSLDGKNWALVAEFSLAGAVVTADVAVDSVIEAWESPVPFWKAAVTAIAGTGAAVDVSGVVARPTSDVA